MKNPEITNSANLVLEGLSDDILHVSNNLNGYEMPGVVYDPITADERRVSVSRTAGGGVFIAAEEGDRNALFKVIPTTGRAEMTKISYDHDDSGERVRSETPLSDREVALVGEVIRVASANLSTAKIEYDNSSRKQRGSRIASLLSRLRG